MFSVRGIICLHATMSAREGNKLSMSARKHNRHQSPSSPASLGSITPGQRTHRSPSPSPVPTQNPREISMVSKTIVDDELSLFERQVVSLTILKEKRSKLQAMVEGKREIPRELKTMRSLPGLGPNYRFSPRMRLKAEELNKQQDREYVALCLSDLAEKVLPDAEQDLEDSLCYSRRRIARKVDSDDAVAAEAHFNKQCAVLQGQGEQLLAKRRPQKKKRRFEDKRPSKKPRQDRPYKQTNRKR